MKKPETRSISPTFYFTNDDIKKLSLPSIFKNLEVSRWSDIHKLIEITSNQELADIQALKEWKDAFDTIKTKYGRDTRVSCYAGRMAKYLRHKDGEREFLDSYHEKEMERLNRIEARLKERIQKKLIIEQYRKLEKQLDEEAIVT